MFLFAGVLTFLLGQAIPYYRFMNATAAPMALTGLGARGGAMAAPREGSRRVAGALGALAVVGALAWLFLDPAINRWAQQDNQWAPQSVDLPGGRSRGCRCGRGATERPHRELRQHR